MDRFALLMAWAVALFLAATSSAQEEGKENWVPLFNGTDLTGFTDVTDNTSEWQVVGGVIEGRGGGPGHPGVLVTDREDFADYKLRITYGCQKPSGGGVEVRRVGDSSSTSSYFVAACVNGYYDMAKFPPGNILKLKSYVYGQAAPPTRASAQLPAAPTRWHLLEITVNGNTVTTSLNGQRADLFTDSKARTPAGAITLVVRGDSIVQFKDIRILELSK
jgi:hypothetical protein